MYKLQKLSNGLSLLTAPMLGAKTVTVLVVVGTGSKYETREKSGLSHFLEHMFFKGTKKRPSTLNISSELDRVGGEYNAFTSKEYTGYWIKVAHNADERGRTKTNTDNLELALDVVSDMLLNSKFEAEEIKREKGVIVEELNMYMDNPLMYIEDLFEQCLYDDTPAGRDTIGTKENILRFERQDFIDYLNSQYGADNIIVCLAGNIDEKVAERVEFYFGQTAGGQLKEKEKVVDEQNQPRIKLHFKKTDQAHLTLGVQAFSFGDRNEAILKIIAMILGGSMSSRLFTELRERRGLAYYVRTQEEAYTDSGYLVTRAGVPLAKIEQAIEVILSEYRKLTETAADNPGLLEELAKAKNCLIGRTALELESSDDLASWYARQAILAKTQVRPDFKTDKVLTPEDYFKKINEVVAEDILRVARRIFLTAKLNLAVIGPFEEEGEFKKILKL